MMAVLMLAAVATISAQTAFAGVILSDVHRDGVILSDNHRDGVILSDKANAWDIVTVVVNGVTGVILNDIK
jgi:hypothetical protein